MARFIVHLADADRITVDASDPSSARRAAMHQKPGSQITKVKIDRTVHAAGPKGRLSMAPRPNNR